METLEKISRREQEQMRHPITPAELHSKYPLSPEAQEAIVHNRQEIEDILAGVDPRKLVVVGPCSLDDQTDSRGVPLIYHLGTRIKELAEDPGISSQIKIVMRVPPAKPRTKLGWTGLENTDLERSYELMNELANGEIPLSMELMHEKHFARYGNLISMGWVGARNVEDTYLRHAVSAHPDIPVLFKNAPSGGIKPALNAMETAKEAHKVDIINEDNQLVEVDSRGNTSTGIVLRGGSSVDSPEQFEEAVEGAVKLNVPFLIDCGHGNAAAHDSGNKSAEGQLLALAHLDSILSENSIKDFKGVMLEAHLERGLSKTDDCISADEMEQSIRELAQTLEQVSKVQAKTTS